MGKALASNFLLSLAQSREAAYQSRIFEDTAAALEGSRFTLRAAGLGWEV
jgi:hypothetical protein